MGIAAAFGIVLSACSSLPPDEDPEQIRTHEMDARLARVEKIVSNQSLLNLANDIESLRNEVKSLRNDMDQLNRNLVQQQDRNAELDARLKLLEGRGSGTNPSGTATGTGMGAAGAAAPGGAGGAPASAAQPVTPIVSNDAIVAGDGTEQGDYQAAFSLLKNSQYDRAIAAFQKFNAAYPSSPLVQNAQYWLGEAYYVTRAYPEALQAFRLVGEKYPHSPKVADAALKTGFCYYELKQWSNARETLTQVTQQYPESSAARLARQRLDKMSSERH